MEPEDHRAESLPLDATPDVRWWASSRIRLGLLLIVLAGLVSALLATSWDSSGLGRSISTPARGPAFAVGCPGRGAPQVRSVPARDLSALRESLLPIMPPQVGRLYESGPVTTVNLWTDNEPQSLPMPSASSSPAGYELRWWALDRDGTEDDVAADVLEFITHGQAQVALRRAASPRCRRDGAAHAAALPAGSEDLFWVNPDNVSEWDVLFVRGRRLYRIVDVPSGYLLTSVGPSQGKLERRRAAATVEVLACALPGAGCAPSRGPVQESGLARVPPASAGHSGAPKITRARARGYAQAVNLRGYDLPGMRQISGEGVNDPRGRGEAFARCVGESTPKGIAPAFHSPVFVHSAQGEYQFVYSDVAFLKNEAAADRWVALQAGAQARECVAQGYRRWMLSITPRSERLRIEGIRVTPLLSTMPVGYRGLGPYRAMRLRLTAAASEITRRGRDVRFLIYIEGGAFVYGDAVVAFTSESFEHPFPQANEEYLTSALLGRAEASSADLVG